MALSLRRHRYSVLSVILLILVFWYLMTAKEATESSAFYKKTASAIERRKNEGPGILGAGNTAFLKGGSVRDPFMAPPKPLDRPVIEDITTEADLKAAESQIDTQLGKEIDLEPVVEGLQRGLEKAAEGARLSSKTPEDLELEKQIIRSRKREQEKLKEELRNQLKYQERDRQRLLSHGTVVNPFWMGAYEKVRRPPGTVAVNEKAPSVDPFRDRTGSSDLVEMEQKSIEKMPDMDPFRGPQPGDSLVQVVDKPAIALREEKHEQQMAQLAKEQEYLHPEPVADIKPHLVPVAEHAEHMAAERKLAEEAPMKGRDEAWSRKETPPVPINHAIDPEDYLAASKVKTAAEDKDAARKRPVVPKDQDPLASDTKQPNTPLSKSPAELELSRVSALSPVVIFSKSYCPHSKKAKRILQQAFNITPSPYVVELDRVELGPELQALLREKTGRATVPNVLVEGTSIGGGDDVEKLWETGKLKDKIKELGGKRILAIVEDTKIAEKGWTD